MEPGGYEGPPCCGEGQGQPRWCASADGPRAAHVEEVGEGESWRGACAYVREGQPNGTGSSSEGGEASGAACWFTISRPHPHAAPLVRLRPHQPWHRCAHRAAIHGACLDQQHRYLHAPRCCTLQSIVERLTRIMARFDPKPT